MVNAFDELVTSLVTGGMDPAAAASLVARAVIEASAKPKTSGAERTRRWRERHKASQSVTVTSPPSPVTVTSQPSQSVTCDAAAAEELPLTTTSLSDSQGIQKEESKEVVQSTELRARGTRLPDNWEPSAANWKFASGRGLRALDIEIEATKFRNYWTAKPGAGARKVNWDRTWENWILNSKAGSKNGTTGNVIDAADRLLERIDQFERGDDTQLLGEVRGRTGTADVRLLPSK